jgi:TolB-like protein
LPIPSAVALPKIGGDASSDTQVIIGLFARYKMRLLGVIAAAVLILTGLGYGAYHWHSSSSHSSIESLAVIPFTNEAGDANTDYLSDGMTESLIDNLAHVPKLRVKSRNTVFRYKGKDVDVQKVGNALGVSALVSGRVVPRGDGIEVSAELTDVQDSTVIW